MSDKYFEPEISRSLKRIAQLIHIPFPVAIECKKETGTSLSFSRVDKDQIQALVDFECSSFTQKMRVASSVGGQSRFQLKTGFDFLDCPSGKSFVLVNFRATKKDGGKDIPKGTNRCFAVPISQFLQARHELGVFEERKSFPYKWFEENALEIHRTSWKESEKTIYGWELSPLWH